MKLPNRKSLRLKDYDYSKEGGYFITICTDDRKMLFGEVREDKMILNDLGKVVESIWESLPERFPIILDTYQIMPNHFHGIIIIDDNPSHFTLGNIIAYFKYQSTKQINNIVGVGSSNPPPINVSKQGRENPAPTNTLIS